MGTIRDKLAWLIDKKKKIINTINSRTFYTNTTGSSKPLSGTYANVDWDKIIKEADTFYPRKCPEVILIRHYTSTGVLFTGSGISTMNNYAYPGVNLTVSRSSVGVYVCTLSRPNEIEYSNVSIMVMGGHYGTSYNNAVNAGVIVTNQTHQPTKNFEIRLADDNTLNDGYFTVIISVTR